MQAQAGHALAGWSKHAVLHGNIPVPSISIIMGVDDENNDKYKIDAAHLNNFIVSLFDHTYEGLKPGQELWLLAIHCFVTFVMYLPQFERLASPTDIIVKKFRTTAKNLGISSSHISSWSGAILTKRLQDKTQIYETSSESFDHEGEMR